MKCKQLLVLLVLTIIFLSAYRRTNKPIAGNIANARNEKETLFSLVDGLSYKKIGEKYFISLSTNRTHICNIYAKLHVQIAGSSERAAGKTRFPESESIFSSIANSTIYI